MISIGVLGNNVNRWANHYEDKYIIISVETSTYTSNAENGLRQAAPSSVLRAYIDCCCGVFLSYPKPRNSRPRSTFVFIL
jgi:hypothetical protein